MLFVSELDFLSTAPVEPYRRTAEHDAPIQAGVLRCYALGLQRPLVIDYDVSSGPQKIFCRYAVVCPQLASDMLVPASFVCTYRSDHPGGKSIYAHTGI